MNEPLDSFLIADIVKSKTYYEQLRQFHWEYFSELAYQRNRIYEPLKNSLRERAQSFDFSKWQRAVKYKYALQPLSMGGSVTDPGGRFNIGAIDTARYPVFGALYIASDKSTALTELLGQGTISNSLTAEELALTKPDSIAAVSVSGHLDSVLDVRDPKNLAQFVSLIRGFRVSRALTLKAARLRFPLKVIRSIQELTPVLRASDWRNWPTVYDVPAAGQIFGRIVFDAQIDGVLYSSVLTEKPCLAIYSQNFQDSPSYIELDDPVPSEIVVRRRDASNCLE